jgi:glycolate oxidase iron-sulfur subunit
MRADLVGPLADTAAGAIAENVLRACVHCGMCNATCPTYHLTGDELDGPRGRIYLIKQVLEGESAGRLTQHHLDRCLSCRACETTCPSGVEYHRLLDIGREAVAAHAPRPWRERLARWGLRAVVPHPARLAPLFALGRVFRFALPAALARKIPASTAVGPLPGPRHDRNMALLPGCVQAVAAPHFNAATRRVFDAAGVSLNETAGVGCCGALSYHADAHGEAQTIARRNIAAWSAALDAGAEAIIVNSSGCAAFIRDYPDVFADDPATLEQARRIAAAVRDPVEVLSHATLTPKRPPVSPRIAVHDPCTLRNGPKLGGQVAELLRGLGYDPQPVAEAHMCCGSAGAYSLFQPDLSKRLRDEKVAALNATRPQTLYTANIGCWMQLAETSPVPVRHWIEAVDDLVA